MRDLSQEPLFPTDDIQGDILVGLAKRHEHFIFFQITDTVRFKAFLKSLHLTSMRECLDQRAAIKALKDKGSEVILPTPGLNIAFTSSGLTKLAVPSYPPANGIIDSFVAGMDQRRAKLGDPKASSWSVLEPSDRLHGVFILAGASHAEITDIISLRLATANANGWRLRHEEVGDVRPEPVRGHEHFGYADGVSQPGVRGRVSATEPLTVSVADENQGQAGQDLLWPGEFLFGYPGQDPNAASLTIKGPETAPPIPFMRNGAFMVFRRLAQKVPEFNAAVKAAAAGITGTANPMNPDLFGAQLVGRWKSGAPLINAPLADDPTIGDGTPQANDFEFGDDREGLKCPWAAHVRKAYPRDDVPNELTPIEERSNEAESETQTHRMMRRGIAFGPEVSEQEALNQTSTGGSSTRGLLFACYVTSIEDQFEFVQQKWCNEANFTQPGSGVDPIIGQGVNPKPFLGAAPQSLTAADKPHIQFGSFVTLEGGAYFFAPAISALRGL